MEYLFTALIPIIAVTIIVMLAKHIAAHRFKCPRCGEEFHIQWQKVIVTEHSGSNYMLVCPHCKAKGWCAKQPGNHP